MAHQVKHQRRISLAFFLCMLIVWAASLWWRTKTYDTMLAWSLNWILWVLCQGSITGLIGWYLRGVQREPEEAKDGTDSSTAD